MKNHFPCLFCLLPRFSCTTCVLFSSSSHSWRLPDPTPCPLCPLLQGPHLLWLLWGDAMGSGAAGAQMWRLDTHTHLDKKLQNTVFFSSPLRPVTLSHGFTIRNPDCTHTHIYTHNTSDLKNVSERDTSKQERFGLGTGASEMLDIQIPVELWHVASLSLFCHRWIRLESYAFMFLSLGLHFEVQSDHEFNEIADLFTSETHYHKFSHTSLFISGAILWLMSKMKCVFHLSGWCVCCDWCHACVHVLRMWAKLPQALRL